MRYDIPLYPVEPQNDEEAEIQARYDKIMGSAVNPVLFRSSSGGTYAQKNPHRMGLWSKASRTHVAHIEQGDLYASEQSAVMAKDTSVKIVLEASDGQTTILKPETALLQDEVIDASFMDKGELCEFFERERTHAQFASQGNHDESIRSYHVWSLRQGHFQGCICQGKPSTTLAPIPTKDCQPCSPWWPQIAGSSRGHSGRF